MLCEGERDSGVGFSCFQIVCLEIAFLWMEVSATRHQTSMKRLEVDGLAWILAVVVAETETVTNGMLSPDARCDVRRRGVVPYSIGTCTCG